MGLSPSIVYVAVIILLCVLLLFCYLNKRPPPVDEQEEQRQAKEIRDAWNNFVKLSQNYRFNVWVKKYNSLILIESPVRLDIDVKDLSRKRY